MPGRLHVHSHTGTLHLPFSDPLCKGVPLSGGSLHGRLQPLDRQAGLAFLATQVFNQQLHVPAERGKSSVQSLKYKGIYGYALGQVKLFGFVCCIPD